MTKLLERPSISAGGLVTVAFLKAQLDSGEDHLNIFLPLILDTAKSFKFSSFVKHELQEKLSELHGVAMPQQVIGTLLDRAMKNRFVSREMGRYKNTLRMETVPALANATKSINESQMRLAQALIVHSSKRKLNLGTLEAALDMLLRFLETEQVVILLGGAAGSGGAKDANHHERMVTASFIQDVVANDEAFQNILNRMLEGLVLYHAAFLPDLSAANRKFKNLKVAFDSSLVRQALGLEGSAAQTLMRETLSLLNSAGVQCLVFETTVEEIRRILAFYEHTLATTQGQKNLRTFPMARHFLTQRMTPGDVRQISALLIKDIQGAGFLISPMPQRKAKTTAGEKILSERLASSEAKEDEIEPRVQHDVDCIAAVLTLRGGTVSSSLEEAKAVFAADQPSVIRNIARWYREDEHGSGIDPIVNVRAIANLAWLKKPSLSANFKMHELVSLCTATLRPSGETWNRFLRHLEKLQSARALSEDEITAIIVSATSDRLLREAETVNGDDIDVTTLDEIVDKVKEEYAGTARIDRERLQTEHDESMRKMSVDLTDALAQANESERRRQLAISNLTTNSKNRADKYARNCIKLLTFVLNSLLALGVFAILKVHIGEDSHSSAAAWIAFGSIFVFYVVEWLLLRHHLAERARHYQMLLSNVFIDKLDPEAKYRDI